MATKKSQRIGIWVIAGVMLLGTIGGFIAMMVQPANEARDKEALESAQREWTARTEEVEEKRAAQAAELSERYFAIFSPFSSRVGAFEADGVDELKTEDLVMGEGEEVKSDTKLAVYYIGWNPTGQIFDQSINGDALNAPFSIAGPANANVIKGWQQGLVGMRIGGVRELTIPSDLAYGEQGSGELIPANTPLKFVVMAIAAPEEIADAEAPQLIRDYYKRNYGIDI